MIGQSFEERAPRALNVDGMIFYGQKVTGCKAPPEPAYLSRLGFLVEVQLSKHGWSDAACRLISVYESFFTFVFAGFFGLTRAKYETFMEANLCSIKIFQGYLVHIMLGVHYGSCYGWLYPARWYTEVL